MLKIGIEVPNPSRYLKHDVIDRVALEYNKSYRQASTNRAGFPVDIEHLIDLLEIAMLWEDIDEPEETLFLAKLSRYPQERITINQRHSDLFDERPCVYASALGHEIGHKVLRHSDHPELNVAAPTLFSPDGQEPRCLHKSSWGQFGMTREEVLKRQALVKEITKQALVNEQARRVISQLNSFHEPEWMFWQAEHFSRCLLIPKDRLLEELENARELGRWSGIYRLAERFGVSGPIMKGRLVKLGIIEIAKDGNPRHICTPRQESLFN